MDEVNKPAPKKKAAPKTSEDDLIEVITLKKIGLEDRTSKRGERVFIKRKFARIHQDNGAVKVVI